MLPGPDIVGACFVGHNFRYSVLYPVPAGKLLTVVFIVLAH